MGGIKLLTVVYAIMFVVMIVIAIGSLAGLFQNHLINPGL
jgi:hypothetical protein